MHTNISSYLNLLTHTPKMSTRHCSINNTETRISTKHFGTARTYTYKFYILHKFLNISGKSYSLGNTVNQKSRSSATAEIVWDA